VGIATGRVQVEVRGGTNMLARKNLPGRMEPDGSIHEGQIESRSLYVELAACHLWGERFFYGPCASIAAVRSFARGEGFEHPGHPVLYWAAASLAGQAGIRVTRWLEPFFEGGLGVVISRRPHFIVETDEMGQTRTSGETLGNRLVPYGRVGLRCRWQPTRAVAAP
jgi:hypothetical protein